MNTMYHKSSISSSIIKTKININMERQIINITTIHNIPMYTCIMINHDYDVLDDDVFIIIIIIKIIFYYYFLHANIVIN